jgi:hypothetical protein
MIAHVVLFRPRADAGARERRALVAALRVALREIPSLRRVTFGRRVTHGTKYEMRMAVDYSYAAILEFDDLAGLQAYLTAPAHAQLSTCFHDVSEEALTYDFEGEAGEQGLSALLTDADRSL